MLTRRSVPLLLLLLALFAVGIGRLFVLRFEKGDIYPPYSTLRADPLGAKAWYGALREIGGFNVTRNYRPLHQLPKEGRQVIFYLGMPRRYFDGESDLDELDARARAGARVIIALQPENTSFDPAKETADLEKQRKKADPKNEEKIPLKRSDLWKIKIVSLEKIGPATTSIPGLEPEISGHAHVAFSPQHPGWRTLYSTGGKAVIVERTYGLGSIVLCADSWVFSNEALRLERRPQFLARTLGDRTDILFDETHHGVLEDPGIATLARRYRLHAAFAICLLLGILFVWRNAVPFVPPEPASADTETVSGHDAASGLTNLLRRGISPKQLAATCLTQWRQSQPRPVSATDLETAQAVAADTAKTPLERYQALCKLLTIHAKRN